MTSRILEVYSNFIGATFVLNHDGIFELHDQLNSG